MYMAREVGLRSTGALANRGDRGVDSLVSYYFARDGRRVNMVCISLVSEPSVLLMGLMLCLCDWPGM